MRINCEVQVSNRKCPSLNMSDGKRNSRSSLGLGRVPGSKADVSSLFIHLCTAQNKKGTKYKVSGNIEGVFTKFVAEGKFTLRFKEPTHDLCVKADPVLAKSFLQTLKLGLQNKDIDKMHLSNLAPVKQSQVEKPKTKLIIDCKKNYPITTSFPYSLQSLMVSDVDLNRVENRIIKLKKLQILNLSHNVIRHLPESMNQMHVLAELHLSHNKICDVNHKVFMGNLSKTLRLLDLSDNEMQYLPHTLVHLQNLVNLNISGNKLCSLPISLGKLHNLKFLTASKNRLIELPASLRYLNLDTIDIYGNPLSRPFGLITDNATDRVPLLKEIASANCVRRRLHPTAADIPLTLVNYVNAWLKCPCGRICYESHILACIPLNISSLATSFVKSDVGTVTPALATLCSKKCYNKYSSK